jgi:hypothetical protein
MVIEGEFKMRNNFPRHMRSRLKSHYIHSGLRNYKSSGNQTTDPPKANNDFLSFMIVFVFMMLGILATMCGR